MLQRQKIFKLWSLNMISKDLRKFWGKLEIETYIIQLNQSKNQNIIVQNLSWMIFFQEQVKFLKSGIWFQFYNPSNSPGMLAYWTRRIRFWNSCQFCQLSSHIKELPLFCAPFAIVSKISKA